MLHLILKGDFDGTSAHELLDVLRKRDSHISQVLIDTSKLRDIHPFGLHVLRSHGSVLKGQSVDLLFRGEYASQFELNYKRFP